MKDRCNNKKHKYYFNYGGRGIKVCKNWMGKNGFKNFLSNMGLRPSNKHSLDRIDNKGNYTPKNCQWSTRSEQASNTRRNRWVKYNGQDIIVTHFAAVINTPLSSVIRKLNTGMNAEDVAYFYAQRKKKTE